MMQLALRGVPVVFSVSLAFILIPQSVSFVFQPVQPSVKKEN
jgi:hypothetical protein